MSLSGKSEILAPPGILERYASYVVPSVIAGKFDADRMFMAMVFPRMQRNVMYTAGQAINVDLNTTGTPYVMQADFSVGFHDEDTYHVGAPLLDSGVAIFPNSPVGTKRTGWAFKTLTSMTPNDLCFDFTLRGAQKHEAVANVTLYLSDWSVVGTYTTAFDASGEATVKIVAVIAANTDYYVGASLASTLNEPFGEMICKMIMYFDDGASGYHNLIFPNKFTTCFCHTVSPPPSQSTKFMVPYTQLHVQCTASSLNNGGEITTARLVPGWQNPPGTDLYTSISQLPYNSYVGKFSEGSYAWNCFESVLDYKPYRAYDVADNLPTLIAMGKAQTTDATFQYIVHHGIIHFGSDRQYSWKYPDFTHFNEDVLHALSECPAAMANGDHAKFIRTALSTIKRTLSNPNLWRKGGEIAKAVLPIVAGFF